jgi:hypothetical protein
MAPKAEPTFIKKRTLEERWNCSGQYIDSLVERDPDMPKPFKSGGHRNSHQLFDLDGVKRMEDKMRRTAMESFKRGRRKKSAA